MRPSVLPNAPLTNPKHPSRTIIPSGGRSRKNALRRASSSSRFRWFQSSGHPLTTSDADNDCCLISAWEKRN